MAQLRLKLRIFRSRQSLRRPRWLSIVFLFRRPVDRLRLYLSDSKYCFVAITRQRSRISIVFNAKQMLVLVHVRLPTRISSCSRLQLFESKESEERVELLPSEQVDFETSNQLLSENKTRRWIPISLQHTRHCVGCDRPTDHFALINEPHSSHHIQSERQPLSVTLHCFLPSHELQQCVEH